MTDVFDPATRSILDQFDVPPMREGLADTIMAAAMTRPTLKTTPSPTSRPLSWPRNGARHSGSSRSWARKGIATTIMATAAFMTVSAAAAAGGWFGERVVQLPVIRSIATVMPEIVKAKPKGEAKTQVAAREILKPAPPPVIIQKPAPTPDAAPQANPEPPVTPMAIDMKPVRQEARVERFTSNAQRALDARDMRRAARGLPSNTQRERALIDQIRAAKSPEERATALTAARAVRQERRDRMELRRQQRGLAGSPGAAPVDGLAGSRRMALPLCSPEQARTPRINKCRPPRRACADIPAGKWLPPRCRAEAVVAPDKRLDAGLEQRAEIIPQ
jgi:hypothetical protein